MPSHTPRTTPPSRTHTQIRLPSYRLHKPSGQAVVTLAGRDHYLGKHGSEESREAYQRRLAEWLAAGGASSTPRPAPGSAMTIAELILAYWGHVKTVYPEATREGMIAPILRRLRRLYGSSIASEFGPLALKGFRQSLLQEITPHGKRLSRPYINRCVQWVKRMFRWAVGEELISSTVLHALQAVEPIRVGRSNAPEPPPVLPVPDAHVEAVLPHLPPMIADMVRIQRLTGMRPGELCAMTTGELDTTGTVWMYTPRHHKTAHHGKQRLIPIGPRAQEVLRRYLRPDLSAPVFSPSDSERLRKQQLRAARVTPLTPSQRKRDARNARKRPVLRERYTTSAYALPIYRACDRAGVPRWSPNRLRHSKATELRKAFGLDAAGAVLGHSRLETTQIYAERSMSLAVEAARQTG